MNNNQGRRRTRRVRQQRKQKNTQISRILLTICMMALVAVVSIGGTMAWLQDETETVTNTFATTGIELKLTETQYSIGDDGSDVYADEPSEAPVTNDAYRLIPGKEYTKDPTVTVVDLENDVDVYLFVKFDKGTSDLYLDYTSMLNETNNWTPLTADDNNNVWYRVVDADATQEEKTFKLIADDKVTVKTNLVELGDKTEGMVEMPEEAISMTYTAYAIQKEGFATPVDAWNEISE